VACAADDPPAVAGLLLRSPFLARAEDVDAFFADAPAPLAGGWRTLPEADDPAACRLAEVWWRHEARRTGSGAPMPPPAALLQRYRIQGHYLRAGCWLQSPSLLELAARVPRVPALVLHGTHDRVCPPEGARRLAAALPGATLAWAEGAGHDPTHPCMAAQVRAALDGFAATGRFPRA
jgi:proline iminopeptidase